MNFLLKFDKISYLSSGALEGRQPRRAADAGGDLQGRELRHERAVLHRRAEVRPDPGGHDPSLFRRLVLGWIEADFRVQIRIF